MLATETTKKVGIPYIASEVRGKVAILTMDRPETLNAWRDADRIELGEKLNEFSSRPEIVGIVLTGRGDKAFCSGQDLQEAREMAIRSRDEAVAFWTRFRDFYEVVRRIEKPVVTALNGVAAGSAFQITMHTDIVVAHPGARMGQTEINSGIGSITGTYFMRECLGKTRAMELALSGRLMEAGELHSLGLVHHVVPQEHVLDRAVAIATELGLKSSSAMALTKRAHRQSTQDGFDRIWDLAIQYQSDLFQAKDMGDVMKKFFTDRGHS